MANVAVAGEMYRKSMLATASSRAVESAALAKVTAELQSAADRATKDHPAYIAALSKNLALWTLLAADAAHPGNALQVELRASIIRLASFVRRQTLKLQSGGGGEIEGLLEINRNILIGLQGAGSKDARP